MENNLNVYISSDNIISSLGFTTQENIDAILAYQSGIRVNSDRRIADQSICAAAIDSARLENLVKQHHLEEYTHMEQLFILSIKEMLSHSTVNPDEVDCGLVISTTKGNIDVLQKYVDKVDNKVFLWDMTDRIANYFHLENRVTVVSNACISGVSALIVAKRLIEKGIYKKVIVAGGDILSHFITSGFLSFRAVSEKVCCPYDLHRDGLNLGEACGSILLTVEKPDNAVLLTGGAVSNDANHISGPSRTGDGLYYAICQAMEEANMKAGDISFVNAHGTATVYNDEMESKAIHLAQLQHVPVNSMKSFFGHTMGASGVIESIICIHELKEGILFGTLGYRESGVPMPLIVQEKHKKMSMKSCIKTASGFAGCNAAIVLSLPANAQKPIDKEGFLINVPTKVSIENSQIKVDDQITFSSENKEFNLFIREAYKNLGENNQKFYKMDDMCKIGYVATAYLLKEKPSYSPTEIGIILGNSSSSLHTDIKHQLIIDKEGDAVASPAIFVYTLPNLVLGEICIRYKIQGENTFFVSKEYNPDEMEEYAKIVMQKGNLKACIVGWCELFGNQYKAEFKIIEKQ